MRKQLLILLFLFISLVNAQKREFKNQGEQEDYWVEQLFQKEYTEQTFENFKGIISIKDNHTIIFDNKTLVIWTNKPELMEIFIQGIFYPQLIIGNKENIPRKTKAEITKLNSQENFEYLISINDSLQISNFEELKFLEKSPQKKRFRFWNHSSGLSNPQVYLLELTNNNAKEDTDLKTFISGSKLTFLKTGWIII